MENGKIKGEVFAININTKQCKLSTRTATQSSKTFNIYVTECKTTGSPIRTHTHTRLTDLFPGLPRWAGTRKVKPIWILLKQETVSGSAISWAICKSAPRSRQITRPAPHHSVFYRPDALPAAQSTASKHWRRARAHTHTHTHSCLTALCPVLPGWAGIISKHHRCQSKLREIRVLKTKHYVYVK